MDLTDCGKKFQAIANLCLNDSFPTLEFGLSRVSFMLSLILHRRGTLGFVILQFGLSLPFNTFVKVLNALRYLAIVFAIFAFFCGNAVFRTPPMSPSRRLGLFLMIVATFSGQTP